LDYNKSLTDNSIQPINGIFRVKQRAEVEGYMKLSKAIKLYDELKKQSHIKIKISDNIFTNKMSIDNLLLYNNDIITITNSLDKYTKLSYVIENNSYRFMEMEEELNELISHEYENSPKDKKFSMMNHVVRKYFIVRSCPLKKLFPSLIENDIVGVSIMDLTWNRNDFLWEKILFVLKNI